MENQQGSLVSRVILEVKTSRTGEETPEAMVQFLSSLLNLKKRFFYLHYSGVPIALEMAVIDQRIHFYISLPSQYQSFIESQLAAQYPKVLISKVKDYLPEVFKNHQTLYAGQLKLIHNFIYPIRTTVDFKDVDPMASIISMLSKAQSGDTAVIQFLLVPISNGWQRSGRKFIDTKKTDAAGSAIPNPYTQVVTQKIAYNGFKTAIRIVVNSESIERSNHYLHEIAHSFASFNNPSGNGLVLRKPILWQKNRLLNAVLHRQKSFMPMRQILNVAELATMFHFPTMALANIPNISWHKVILSDPPEMLPIAEGLSDEEKSNINFFASTQFKNKPTTFGIKLKDRRRHVYVIGKTGAGKSTLIANMAISDMRNRRGFCIIDPHGDLCETLLDYVPSYRVNDIVYLDPGDHERAFSLNPLQVQDDVQKELVVSGIVAIFQKLFAFSWGPRLEYILRNTLLSVIEMPDATLLMVPELLTNQKFRNKVVANLKEPVLINYWKNEFEKMPDRQRNEAMAPILNKVGQFVQSTVIRNIIKSHNSTIDLARIMNEGKILLLNLSQGRLGEDNAALLGAMIITKIQLAAMARVNLPEEERKDFYLYVDEFQNFATSSFIKILSEARKYRLNLLLANQYIAQVPEDVRAAIFGNAGTMLSFLIGATDATYMAKEFGERFKEEDLLALGNYQAITKLCVDNVTQAPFLSYTLPLPRSITQNRQKVINSSKQRYTKVVNKIFETKPNATE
ncbi:MAG TPA: DUF87 domain-containing protein [Candidatus Saccharimonadales bacterium]|nr:DUF87 domain-containing protein [Candidatus Saccharimonadales bacterium]